MFKHIISLGRLCLARVIIDHLRLKFKIRMPFDGSYHSYDFMCEMLNTNFKGYLDNVTLQKQPSGNTIWTKGVAFWNHEKTLDFESLEKNCKDRIQQFNDVLNSGDSIMFLHWDELSGHNLRIQKVTDIIKHRWPNLKFHVVQYNSTAPEEKIITGDNYTYMGLPFCEGKLCANEYILKPTYAKELQKVIISLCNILQEDPPEQFINIPQ